MQAIFATVDLRPPKLADSAARTSHRALAIPSFPRLRPRDRSAHGHSPINVTFAKVSINLLIEVPWM